MSVTNARVAGHGAQKWRKPREQLSDFWLLPSLTLTEPRPGILFRGTGAGGSANRVSESQVIQSGGVVGRAESWLLTSSTPVLLESAKGAVPRRQEAEGPHISAAARTRPVLRVLLER